MPNSSRANARRKRLATKKLQSRATHANDKNTEGHRNDKLDQQVSFGHPGNLGSGSQIGSAKDEVTGGDDKAEGEDQ
jgi:hypothetical protein